MTLRKLKIGTYVSSSPSPDGNPYYPISTATMDTPVFDVVHMFSECGISAVPIVDANGIVVNLYETVDVIVRICLASRLSNFLHLRSTSYRHLFVSGLTKHSILPFRRHFYNGRRTSLA